MIAIIDYKAGNLTSVQWALREVGIDAIITSDPDALAKADRVIFPGVGAAGAAMEELQARGLDAAVRGFVASGKPFLGICIGCQVILDSSEEDGGISCLGLLGGSVKRFPTIPGLKVPHMGTSHENILSSTAFRMVRSFISSTVFIRLRLILR